jgi:hypothetical protein
LPAFRYQLRWPAAADSASLLFADYFFIDTPSSPIYAIAAAEIRFSPYCHAMPIRRQLPLAEACFDAATPDAFRFSMFFTPMPLSSMADIFSCQSSSFSLMPLAFSPSFDFPFAADYSIIFRRQLFAAMPPRHFFRRH